MSYSTVSQTFIKDNISQELYEVLFSPCYNLSAVLSDIDGKFSDSIAIQVTQRLNVNAPGLLVMGTSVIDALRIRQVSSIPQDTFIPEISHLAYDLYNRITLGSSSMRVGTTATSELLEFDKNSIVNPNFQIAACAIYMDMYAVYYALLEATQNSGIKLVTSRDMNRILNNIRCLSNAIEITPLPPYQYIETLRDSYRTLVYVKSLKSLFNESQVNKISDYRGYSDRGWD